MADDEDPMSETEFMSGDSSEGADDGSSDAFSSGEEADGGGYHPFDSVPPDPVDPFGGGTVEDPLPPWDQQSPPTDR